LFFFVRDIAFLPGWHQIVAAAAGRLLDTSLRADDLSMKTTDHAEALFSPPVVIS
jgi:hypothetical protein